MVGIDYVDSRLASAVIVQAIRDMCSYSERERNRALDWILSDDFDWWCQSAGYNADILREKIVDYARPGAMQCLMRPRAPLETNRKCLNCGNSFDVNAKAQRYCSYQCAQVKSYQRRKARKNHVLDKTTH
jgi:predicted nucleic acid-binding Zn ribbon protein